MRELFILIAHLLVTLAKLGKFDRQDEKNCRGVPERCLLNILRRSPLRERTLASKC
jgi:hypothetical protein